MAFGQRDTLLISYEAPPIFADRVCVKHQQPHLLYCCCHNKQCGMQKAGSGFFFLLTCVPNRQFVDIMKLCLILEKVKCIGCFEWMIFMMVKSSELKALHKDIFFHVCVVYLVSFYSGKWYQPNLLSQSPWGRASVTWSTAHITKHCFPFFLSTEQRRQKYWMTTFLWWIFEYFVFPWLDHDYHKY